MLLRRQGRTARLCVQDPTRTGESVERGWDRPVREAPDPVGIPATEPRPAAARHSGGGMRDARV
ncbi:hypothetical protein AB0K42_33340 [Streptomyces albogriseolus]